MLTLEATTAYAQRGRAGYPTGSGRTRETNNDDTIVESFNAPAALLACAIIALLIVVVVRRKRRRTRTRSDRERQVRLAAAEAVRDDPAFAPTAVKAAAAALYTELQRAWSDLDDGALERGLGPELLADWRRGLQRCERRGWIAERAIVEGPRVAYVGLVNHEGEEDDRVTVAITATVNRTVRSLTDEPVDDERAGPYGDVEVTEYWTLARYGDAWRVVVIDGAQTAPYYLSAPIVPRPEPGEDVPDARSA